jgi:hypothetical protein
MYSRIEPNSTSGVGRVLARQLAREMTRDELRLIAGGQASAGPSVSAVSSTQPNLQCGSDEDPGTDDFIIGHN